MVASPGTALPALALAALCGGVAGAVVAAAVLPRGDNEPRAAAPGRAEELSELAAELRALVEELRRSSSLGLEPSAGRVEVARSLETPNDGTTASFEPLALELGDLITLLRARPSIPAGTGAPDLRPPPESASRDALFAQATSSIEDQALRSKEQGALSRKHLLWSVQDVIDAYGEPDSAYPSDVGYYSLYYRDPSRSVGVFFDIADDRVLRVRD